MPISGRAGAAPALEPQEAYPPARSTALAGYVARRTAINLEASAPAHARDAALAGYVARRTNPLRPNRAEPRCKKRRAKQFDLMNKPRDTLRKALGKRRNTR